MKTLLSFLAIAAFIAPAFAGDELNANCCCGKPASKDVAPVVIKVDGKDHSVAVCSKECAEKIGKMDGKEVLKAVEAHNKAPATVK
jgi:hypothetical protein